MTKAVILSSKKDMDFSIRPTKYYTLNTLARNKVVPVDVNGKTVSMTLKRLTNYVERGYIPSIMIEEFGKDKYAIQGRDLIQYYRLYELGALPLQNSKKKRKFYEVLANAMEEDNCGHHDSEFIGNWIFTFFKADRDYTTVLRIINKELKFYKKHKHRCRVCSLCFERLQSQRNKFAKRHNTKRSINTKIQAVFLQHQRLQKQRNHLRLYKGALLSQQQIEEGKMFVL